MSQHPETSFTPDLSSPQKQCPDEQAIAWLVRLQDDQASETDRRAWSAWMDQNPIHAQSWRKIQRIWHGMEDLAPRRASTTFRHRALRQRAWSTLATAAAVLLVVAGITSISLHHSPGLHCLGADYCTRAGELRQITLADGSRISLGAASAISVQMENHQRQVTLRHGEGFFDVAPDTTPFRVKAAAGEVRVLGTSFNLRLEPAGARVAVASGQVEVDTLGHQVTLNPGQVLHYDTSRLQRLPDVDVNSIGLWRQKRLLYQNTPLGEVLRDLERYHSARFSVDPDVAAIPVTGIFSASDPEAALHSIVNSFPVRMSRYTHFFIRISAN